MQLRDVVFTSDKSDTIAASQIGSVLKSNQKILLSKLENEPDILHLASDEPRFKRNNYQSSQLRSENSSNSHNFLANKDRGEPNQDRMSSS